MPLWSSISVESTAYSQIKDFLIRFLTPLLEDYSANLSSSFCFHHREQRTSFHFFVYRHFVPRSESFAFRTHSVGRSPTEDGGGDIQRSLCFKITADRRTVSPRKWTSTGSELNLFPREFTHVQKCISKRSFLFLHHLSYSSCVSTHWRITVKFFL